MIIETNNQNKKIGILMNYDINTCIQSILFYFERLMRKSFSNYKQVKGQIRFTETNVNM